MVFSGFCGGLCGWFGGPAGNCPNRGEGVVGAVARALPGASMQPDGTGGMPRLRKDERTGGATEGEDGSGATAPRESGLLSKIRAFSESWVVGSVAWVESI